MVNRKPVWRAQIAGLTNADATSTCQALSKKKAPCMVLRPDQGQLAAR